MLLNSNTPLDYIMFFMSLSIGFIFYHLKKSKYLNHKARHTYELETKTNIVYVDGMDKFLREQKGQLNKKIMGQNNNVVNGKKLK